jgi:hypothetical protein
LFTLPTPTGRGFPGPLFPVALSGKLLVCDRQDKYISATCAFFQKCDRVLLMM